MATVIDSLWVRLGFQANPEAVTHFQTKVKGLQGAMEALGVVAGFVLVKRLGRFVEGAVRGSAAINDFAEATGIAALDIDAMSRVGLEASASFEGVMGTLRGVAEATGQAALGIGRNVKLFQLLGISAKDSNGETKDAVDVMAELADKFKGMAASKRLAIASRMGIDPNMAAMMAEEGGAGFRAKVAAARSGGLLSANDFKKADETAKSFERFRKLIGDITSLFAIQLAPIINKTLEAFKEWWRVNREEVLEKFRKGISLITEIFDALRRYLPLAWREAKNLYEWFDKLGISSGILKITLGTIIAFKLGAWAKGAAVGIWGLAGAMKGLNLSTGIIGALIFLLILGLQDLYVYMNGGDSITGRLILKFGKWVDVLNTVKIALFLAGAALATFAAIAAAHAFGIGLSFATAFFPITVALAGIMGLISIALQVKDAWNPITQWFGEKLDWLVDKFKTLAAYAAKFSFLIPGVGGIVDMLGGGDAANKFLAGKEQKQSKEDQYADFVARYAPNSTDAQGRGPYSSKSTQVAVKVDKIEVRADQGREAAVGKAIASKLDGAFRNQLRESQKDYY